MHACDCGSARVVFDARALASHTTAIMRLRPRLAPRTWSAASYQGREHGERRRYAQYTELLGRQVGKVVGAWRGGGRGHHKASLLHHLGLLCVSFPHSRSVTRSSRLHSRFNFATLSQALSLCCNLGSRAGAANTQNPRSTCDPLGSSVAVRSYFAGGFGIDTQACPRASHRGWTEEWTLSPRLRTTIIPETTPWRRCPPPCLSKRRPRYPMGLRSK